MSKPVELWNMRFGRLVAWFPLDERTKDGKVLWWCKCDCGKELKVKSASLQSGTTQSCGCLHRERASERSRESNTRHGLCGTKVYKLWKNIKQRCYDPNHPHYPNYGGRGITFHWKETPEVFCLWITDNLGSCPDGYSIDRIDNDGNYEPGNLRWATQSQQQCNKRVQKHSSKYRGVSFYKATQKWKAQSYINGKQKYIGYFATEEEAAAAVNS